MSVPEWLAILIGAGVIAIIWELSRLIASYKKIAVMLQSLDSEVFHLVQEQNPNYGICTNFGHRAIVRHVIPKDGDVTTADPDMFYCQACWWMSDSVRVSDEDRRYKHRPSDRDRFAAKVGPG